MLGVSLLGYSQSDEVSFLGERVEPVKKAAVYPSPATEYLHVKFETPHARKVKLTMHSIIGSIVEVETEVMDDYELRLRVKDFPSGYYLLAIRDQESNYRTTIKFLKR